MDDIGAIIAIVILLFMLAIGFSEPAKLPHDRRDDWE